jgi:3-hydroxybutyryl-CoA dehydratase
MGLKTAASITIGQKLAPRVKPIAQRQIDAYSGVRPKSIHTDAEWAKQKGFAAPLAQGLMSTGYVSQMMVDFLGEGFVRGGSLNVSFIQPVLAGDTLTVHGAVKSKEPEGANTRVTVEFWCENQQGVKTLVGTASGLAA